MFFNTAAFSTPAPGTFGNAGRNTIVGPGTTNVNVGVTNNIFNDVQFATIDTVVNSPTFGRVTSVRAMRRVQILVRVRF